MTLNDDDKSRAYTCTWIHMFSLDEPGTTKKSFRPSVLGEGYTSRQELRINIALDTDRGEDDFGPGWAGSLLPHKSRTKWKGTADTNPDYNFSHSTGSDSSLNVAAGWFKKCRQNHAHCKQPEFDGWYPTRLLDIGTKEDQYIRLNIRDIARPNGPYMTLSHCWGSYRPLMLLQETLDDFKKGIPSESLPKTFVESIAVARYLGVRYLWVDSLCIIQDVKEDWQQEVQTMENVYRFSVLNIAASAGSDSTKGVFKDQSPPLVDPIVVKLKRNGVERLHVLFDQDLWRHNVTQAPLNQRAWVVQERILSSRILHFAEEQLLWECSELIAWESHLAGLNNSLILMQDYAKPPDEFRLAEPLFGFLDARSPFALIEFKRWDSIIHAYCKSMLPKGNDKLAALSGIAKQFQRSHNDVYLAGLWASVDAQLERAHSHMIEYFITKSTSPIFKLVGYQVVPVTNDHRISSFIC